MLLRARPGWRDRRSAAEWRAALRRWRRTRPFWAGLLLLLAGAELVAVPLSPLTVLISLGLGGLAAIGIGVALFAAGLFLWFLPHTRLYVGVHALILSVLSFAATNLGGFLVGMVLGIAGGAMAVGWTPRERARPEPPKALAAVLPVVLLLAVGAPAGAQRAVAADRAGGAREAVEAVEAAGTTGAAGALRGGIPQAARTPPTVTTSLFAPIGFTLAGVVRVPTAAGPLDAMVLRMRAASLTDYRLRTRDGGPELTLRARKLELSGEVTLYLTRFSGCLQGLVCLTFTPDTLPVPPVVPPFVFMTNVDAEQALVTSDEIVADGLELSTVEG
ncbi:DUF6114 domain-containing protein [Streptomyces sp. URMC 123]|uniref:DUF6114 domain-containing protein n=1 Tax=Streptomyces sp. URMC 123 TaxID=3423403 RepID=UPI003F1C5727